jgi:hypothetical protein
MFQVKSLEASVKYKMKYSHLMDNYRKLKLLQAFGCIEGKIFV